MYGTTDEREPLLRSSAGWSLPLSLEGGRLLDGRSDPLGDTARLVLELMPGERRLLPGFGCRIHFLPSIESAAERHVAAALIEESLREWVPSLGVERAEVLGLDDDDLVKVALQVSGRWHHLRIHHRYEKDEETRE